jgi:hypothetical protein
MTRPIEVAFEITSWSEETAELEDSAKLTRADVAKPFTRGVTGEGTVTWLMFYRPMGPPAVSDSKHRRGRRRTGWHGRALDARHLRRIPPRRRLEPFRVPAPAISAASAGTGTMRAPMGKEAAYTPTPSLSPDPIAGAAEDSTGPFPHPEESK